MTSQQTARDVVDFWRDAGPQQWFAKNAQFDADFRARFAELHAAATRGDLSDWARSAEGALALVILLDQYPRNSFRDTPRMFATDEQARAVARQALAAGFDSQVDPELRSFFYMPLMHSESLDDQELCVQLCLGKDPGTLRFARLHREVIERFGRFPHRNRLLGRATTAQEEEFLSRGGFAG